MHSGGKRSFIPQNGSEFFNPVLKIKYQMFETFKANGINKKRDMLAKATDLLYQVGFENPETILNKYSFQLSRWYGTARHFSNWAIVIAPIGNCR